MLAATYKKIGALCLLTTKRSRNERRRVRRDAPFSPEKMGHVDAGSYIQSRVVELNLMLGRQLLRTRGTRHSHPVLCNHLALKPDHRAGRGWWLLRCASAGRIREGSASYGQSRWESVESLYEWCSQECRPLLPASNPGK